MASSLLFLWFLSSLTISINVINKFKKSNLNKKDNVININFSSFKIRYGTTLIKEIEKRRMLSSNFAV